MTEERSKELINKWKPMLDQKKAYEASSPEERKKKLSEVVILEAYESWMHKDFIIEIFSVNRYGNNGWERVEFKTNIGYWWINYNDDRKGGKRLYRGRIGDTNFGDYHEYLDRFLAAFDIFKTFEDTIKNTLKYYGGSLASIKKKHSYPRTDEWVIKCFIPRPLKFIECNILIPDAEETPCQ